MQLTVNGEAREIESVATLADYLARLNVRPQMVVVERNGAIVSREQFAATQLNEGDILEIVQMMAGG